MEAFELAQRLRAGERTRHTPLLVVTRTEADEARLAGVGLAAGLDFLREPVDLERLRGRVGLLLELYARRGQLQALLDASSGQHARLVSDLQQMPAAIAITRGPEFVFEFANAAYERLVGRTVPLGQALRQVLPEVLSQRGVMDVLQRVMATGEPFVGHAFPVAIDRRGEGTAEEAFFDIIYQPILEDGRATGLITHAVEVTAQVRARKVAELAEARARFLAEAGERLTATLDVDAVLGEVARLAVPLIADGCTVDLVMPDGGVERVAVAHADEPSRQRVLAAARRWPLREHPGAPISIALRTGEPLLMTQVSDADLVAWARGPEHLALLRDTAPRSLLYVPLKARGRVLGALCLWQTESGRHFTADDVRLVTELARRASLSLDNALLYREARHAQERTERLQAVTAALARASTESEVATAALEQGLRHLGASRGGLSRLVDGCLCLLGTFGTEGDVAPALRRPRLEALSPVAQAVEQRQALWFSSGEALTAAHPSLVPLADAYGPGARAVLPMESDEGRVIGIIWLAWAAPRDFSAEERAFLEAVARQCAAALERASLHQALRYSEERYRSLVQATSRMAWTADAQGLVVEDVPAWRAFTGQSYEACQGRGWLDAVHPEDRPAARAAWVQALGSRSTYEVEYRVRRADGVYVPTKARGAPVFAPDGTVREWVGANEDLSAREAAQAERERLAMAVATERERLGRLVAQFPTGVTLLLEAQDGKLRYVTSSESYLAMANKQPHQLHGRTPREAFPELEGQGFFELIDRVYTAGEEFRGVGVPVSWDDNGDGKPEDHFVDFFYTPLRGADGRVEGVLIVVSVVDERVRVEREQTRLLAREQAARAEAEAANRLKDEFLSTVSHELRTPLTSMLGWVQMLRSGRLAPEKRERALETLERNARVQAQLIEDLLDVSRIMSGRLRLEVASVDLVSVVEQALESVRPAADAKGIRLSVAPGSAGTVLGDATRLQQVVWNLLSNAVKFTAEGGRVEVAVTRREAVVEVSVTDTGQGIPADFLPHVFERFRQAEAGPTRRYGGLGLGLSIVRHLVEMHGGSVRAASEGEGQGATFTVRLPLASPSRVDVAPAPVEAEVLPANALDQAPSLAGLSILVVDDAADTREMLTALLEGSGARVTVAASAREGLEALRATRPDMLVSDIGMPGEDGYSLIRQVRALSPEEGGRTPSVALTAFARVEDRTRALLAGFQAHCPKPVAPLELLAVLGALAGRGGPG
jgi:PAS domain S-box-containing protein